MSRRFVSILMFIAFLSPLFSLDFGGKVNSTTRLQGPKFKSLKWYESASIHGWLTAVLNEKNQVKFSTDVSYEFRYNQDDGTLRNIIDVNLLKLSAQQNLGASRLECSIGRFPVSDLTGVIFNQVSDGLNAQFASQWFSVNAYIGYTRLLNMHDVVMLMEDGSNTTVDPSISKAVYVIGPSFVPMSLTLSLPSLFLNQTMSLEALTVLNPVDGWNRFYGTFAINGPLYRNIFYSASTTLGTENMSSLSNLTKFNLTYFPVPAASVGFNMFYASGDQKGVDPFRGVTSLSAVLATSDAGMSTEYASKLKLGLNASYTIASCVYLGVDLGVVFTCPDKVSYNGFQWRGDVVWNIFHDLQLAFGMYQYISRIEANNKTCFTLAGTFVF